MTTLRPAAANHRWSWLAALLLLCAQTQTLLHDVWHLRVLGQPAAHSVQLERDHGSSGPRLSDLACQHCVHLHALPPRGLWLPLAPLAPVLVERLPHHHAPLLPWLAPLSRAPPSLS